MGTIMLSDDAHAIGVFASVAGKSRSTRIVDEKRDGASVETHRRVEEFVAHRELCDKAEELVSSLRSLLRKYASHVEPLGYVTDSNRLACFNLERAGIEAAIAEHNGVAGNPHVIAYDVLVLPIGRILDEKTQRRLVATVRDALTDARDAVRKGDRAMLTRWLQHRKNLGGLMPGMVGQVVDTAVEAVREANKAMGKLMRDNPSLTPADAARWVCDSAMPFEGELQTALNWLATSENGVSASAA
jgi:hypothetical protein